MKQKRTYMFIIISSVALIAVLFIQVNWIFQTAKIKEELFNEKANMVLSRTTEALRTDQETCRQIEDLAEKGNTLGSALKLGENEVNTIDSLFKYYLKFYNFHIDYSFEVIKPDPVTTIYYKSMANFYNKPLDDVTGKTGIELKLIFPEKKQFIIAEMGTMFITSVILIFIVLFMFWRTISFLIKEQKIARQTTEFLNNMTHEFKTPLTNIALACKMIFKDTTNKDQDKIKHYSEIILGENEKLQLQVEQVLGMSALERDEIPLRKTKLDFHELINDSFNYIRMQIENKQGNVNLYLDADNSFVMADRTHLANTIYNLVDNAIKYTNGKPEITIRTFNSDLNLVIIVSDNGIGIEKEFENKIFDKFFRVPTGDVHDVKGFGIGLAYIKKIIDLHGGTIKCESEKAGLYSSREKGATFIISLPHV